jgi:hypothetical protein
MMCDRTPATPTGLASQVRATGNVGSYEVRILSLAVSLISLMKTASHAAVHRNLNSFKEAVEEDRWLRNYLAEIVSSNDHPEKSGHPPTSEDLGISIIALIFSGLFEILLNSMTCPKYSIRSWKKEHFFRFK